MVSDLRRGGGSNQEKSHAPRVSFVWPTRRGEREASVSRQELFRQRTDHLFDLVHEKQGQERDVPAHVNQRWRDRQPSGISIPLILAENFPPVAIHDP
jgi:hypothetical protein